MAWMLVPLLILGAFIGVIWRRGLQVRELAQAGVPGHAGVTRKFRTGSAAGSRGRRIGYRYVVAGQTYDRYASLTPGEFAQVKDGQTIPIVYLPHRPGVSAPENIVAAAREALAHKKA